MPGPDDALGRIVAEFRVLGEADRRAILAHLNFDERLRFEAVLHPRPGASGVSPELAALAQDDGLTDAARTALSSALAEAPVPPAHRPTLFDRLWRR